MNIFQRQFLIGAAFVFCAATLSGFAAPVSPGYVEGELLVHFACGPRSEAAASSRRAFRHEIRRNFDRIGWQHIQLAPGETVAQALPRYRAHPGVLAVEPNYLLEVEPMSSEPVVVPDDPKYDQQWPLRQIDATNAWATTTGSRDVVVAVVDSGIDYLHEDLAANMWTNRNEIPGNGRDDDANGYVDDIFGIDVASHDGNPMDGYFQTFTHGTVCAGIIGAAGNNGRGVVGVNWSVQLLAIRFLANSTSNFVASVGFVEACMYLLDQKARGVNIRVASHSYGFTAPPPEVVRTALQSLGEAGVLNVFAAGRKLNGQGADLDVEPVSFPQYWHLPGTLNVAASDQNDQLTVDSNWGATNVDLAAPNAPVVAVQGGSPHTTYYEGGVLFPLQGTSIACPFVAGAAALLASAYPSATADQLRTALLESVDLVPGLNQRVASGGRLNVGRAMNHPLLSRTAPPWIVGPPQSQTNGAGYCACFNVRATGTNLSWQWRANGTNLADNARVSGTTRDTLTVCNLLPADAADYTVVLSNAFGQVTSAVARLTVVTCPVVLAQPQSHQIVDGSPITLRVSAAGAVPLTFQWQREGQALNGATNTTLEFPNPLPADSGNYSVVISNRCNTLTSAVARLEVFGRPLIVEQPQSRTVAVGSDVALRATVTSLASVPMYYSWALNLGAVEWFETSQFVFATNLSRVSSGLAGTWQLLVDNDATFLSGSLITSDPAYVTVVEPPTNRTVAVGESVSFRARAYGTPPITYRWQHDGTDVVDGARVTGAATATLNLTQVLPADAGTYTVLVRNAGGAETGFAATLNVATPMCPVLQMVDCTESSSGHCLLICWPKMLPLSVIYADALGDTWTPWAGPTVAMGDCTCVRIPIDQAHRFFRLLGP